MVQIRALSCTNEASVPNFNSKEKSMQNWKRLTRSLLITGLVLGALQIASPPAGEAADTTTEPTISWELTPEAVQRTLNGECEHMASLEVCREKCIVGVPTGEFACFIG